MAPRSRRPGLATFSEAREMIWNVLRDGEWHRSSEIHERFRPRMSEGMFLRVKKALEIEHRRTGPGRGYFEWRLPRR